MKTFALSILLAFSFISNSYAQALVPPPLPPCGPPLAPTTPCAVVPIGTVQIVGNGGNIDPVSGNGGNIDPVSAGGGNVRQSKICDSIKAQEGGVDAELEGSIVPCGRAAHQCDGDPSNDQCQFSHLFILVNNLVKNFITVVFAPLVVIMITYIGFLFIKEQAGAKAKAKQLLWRLLVGTFFVLAAWLIVNFIVNVLQGNDSIKEIFK